MKIFNVPDDILQNSFWDEYNKPENHYWAIPVAPINAASINNYSFNTVFGRVNLFNQHNPHDEND